MLYYNIFSHAKPDFCRYMPHFNVFITEPVTTGLDVFFAVFCGPGLWSLISEAFWDQTLKHYRQAQRKKSPAQPGPVVGPMRAQGWA